VDEAGAAALRDKIDTQRYQEWTRAPGYEVPRPTIRAHGETAEIYINEVVESALRDESAAEFPVGSIIVKDSREGGTLSLVAAMEKRDGRWFWAEWGADGDVKYAGEPDVCLNCHAAGRDYVLAFAL
jgi:hypothetical protein